MSHFLTYILGVEPELQLALYDRNLPILQQRCPLPRREVERMRSLHAVEDIEDLLPFMDEWYPDQEAGVTDGQLWVIMDENPWTKYDWWIMGGRWHGYLLLKPEAQGKLGTLGTFNTEPMHGPDRSADQCRLQDVDWAGMRVTLAEQAQNDWLEFQADLEEYGENAYFTHGIDKAWTEDDFIAHRSHPSPFALVKDTDWFARDEIGWWGVSLDLDDPSVWAREFDKLMLGLPEDTLITVADCHLGPI